MTQPEPLVSVVIPVFNGEQTIEETVRSVLGQTYRHLEVIVINDGSTDQTKAILERFQDQRLQVVSYSNAGLSASRNRGIDRAAGDYISFIDADDVWTADKIAAQLAALRHHPSAAIAYSWTDYIDEHSQFLQAGTHISASGKVLDKLLTINFIESGSNVLIRRDALRAVGYFDETLKAAEDWDMWLRLAKAYEFIAVPSPQVRYRRTNSMSANVIRQEQECLKVLNRAFKDAPDLQHLRRTSLARLYKYLIFKALEGPPGPVQGWLTAKCLMRAIQYDPLLLKQTRVVLSVAAKIAKAALSPAS
ncbi:MAG: glycosyltransferase [Leptolyngbya sp. SIO4C1]|nr:glycosyltransferase [Leptolyngbya sp. SIO4C1]